MNDGDPRQTPVFENGGFERNGMKEMRTERIHAFEINPPNYYGDIRTTYLFRVGLIVGCCVDEDTSMLWVRSQSSVDKAFFSLWFLDASLILHSRFSHLLTNMALVGVGAHGSHKLQLTVKKCSFGL